VPYNWSTIESVWLGESKVSFSSSQLVQGFNAAEEHLGTDWVERHRIKAGVVHRGALATLPVASMGKTRGGEQGAWFCRSRGSTSRR
jgi:hypothetical protein